MIKIYYFKLVIKLLIVFKASTLFDKINKLDWYQGTLHEWIDAQHFEPNTNILEVGCATGSLANYIKRSGYNISCVDSSEKMIEVARANNRGIEFKAGNAIELPYEDESFDFVIAASLVNIVKDKEKVVSELSRTCKKGGIVSILVPFSNFSDKDLASAQNFFGNSGFSYAAMEAWHKMPPKMSYENVESLFQKSGLIDISKRVYLQGMVLSVSGRKKL